MPTSDDLFRSKSIVDLLLGGEEEEGNDPR